MGVEIERKFLVAKLPQDLTKYKCRQIEQGYLNTNPVVRVRKDNNDYYLTYKGKGKMNREEYNLPLNKDAYNHLIAKTDGNIITKKRYEIPDGKGYTIELDIFEGKFEGVVLAEVEFPNLEECNSYIMPDWFSKDVTDNKSYHNSRMSIMNSDDIKKLIN